MNLSIKNIQENERPREKLALKGAAALSDTELLAILINSGTPTKSALVLAHEILEKASFHVHELGKLNLAELKQVKGIGTARAITIAAALELGRRRQTNEGLQRATLIHSHDAAQILIPLLNDLNYEAFGILYLNQAQKLLRHEIISTGSMTQALVDVRMILKNTLLQNANKIIIAHNHPSGNIQPSEADKKLTQKIKQAAALLDITLLDHLIIAAGTYFSFLDQEIL